MTKLTLSDVQSLQNEGSALLTMHNNNVATVAAVENTLSRDGTAPNQMTADIDMNSNQVINSGDPTNAGDLVSLGYISNTFGAVRYSVPQTLTSLQKAQARANIDAGSAVSQAGVTFFNSRNGIVLPAAGDYTATQVTNTPAGQISAVTVQAAINELDTEKVGANSPALTGVPTAPTASPATNTTQIATTAYADAIAALKANIASPTFTGTPTAPTATPGTNTTQLATTAFTTAAIAALTNPSGYQNGLINGTLGVTAGSNALTISLLTLAGAAPSSGDPVTIVTRNATGTTGNYVANVVNSSTTLVVSSGSTLGCTSATAFRLWIVGFNDAGTFRLGVINCTSGVVSTSAGSHSIFPLRDGVESAVSEGGAGAADSAGTIYSNATVTTKAMRVLGYAEWSSSGLVTAGAWTTTNLISIQLAGPTVKLPGDIVQDRSMITNTQTGTASATFVPTACTLTIIPKSACNLIRATATGTLYVSGTSTSGHASLFRGATQVGTDIQAFNTAGEIISAGMCRANDFPNSTSTQTYTVNIQLITGTQVYWPLTTSNRNADLQLQEIMA